MGHDDGVRKYHFPEGEWGYYHPKCWECGEPAVNLTKLLEIAEEAGRLEEVKWHE